VRNVHPGPKDRDALRVIAVLICEMSFRHRDTRGPPLRRWLVARRLRDDKRRIDGMPCCPSVIRSVAGSIPLFGELLAFLRGKPTHEFRPGLERSGAGRFGFSAFARKGLRELGDVVGRLYFERSKRGCGRNLQSLARTPEFRPETLGISD
jgi:hypothetical protein